MMRAITLAMSLLALSVVACAQSTPVPLVEFVADVDWLGYEAAVARAEAAAAKVEAIKATMAQKYALGPGDSIDGATRKIVRAPKAKERK